MKLTEVKYSKTFNLGNYESERIEITTEINEAIDTFDNVIKYLKEMVSNAKSKKNTDIPEQP